MSRQATDEIAHLRRTYRACCARLGMSEPARRALNAAATDGRSDSSKDFALAEWRWIVSKLQQQCGQDVSDGRPRLRKPKRTPVEGGAGITVRQLDTIRGMAARVPWRREDGLTQWIRKRMLAKYPTRAAAWSGRLEELPSDIASDIIIGLQRWLAHLSRRGGLVATAQEVCRA